MESCRKEKVAKEFNDFRPIALTSVLGKCMERVVLDSLQFSYRAPGGTDNKVLTFYNSVAEHVQQT